MPLEDQIKREIKNNCENLLDRLKKEFKKSKRISRYGLLLLIVSIEIICIIFVPMGEKEFIISENIPEIIVGTIAFLFGFLGFNRYNDGSFEQECLENPISNLRKWPNFIKNEEYIELLIYEFKPYVLYLRSFDSEADNSDYSSGRGNPMLNRPPGHYQEKIEELIKSIVNENIPIFSFFNFQNLSEETVTLPICSIGRNWEPLFKRYAREATLIILEIQTSSIRSSWGNEKVVNKYLPQGEIANISTPEQINGGYVKVNILPLNGILCELNWLKENQKEKDTIVLIDEQSFNDLKDEFSDFFSSAKQMAFLDRRENPPFYLDKM